MKQSKHTPKKTPSFADDLREMMRVWNFLEKEAEKFAPNATAEERYQMCASAMKKQLGLT